MQRRQFITAATSAAIISVAGCTGGTGSNDESTDEPNDSGDVTETATPSDSDGEDTPDDGNVSNGESGGSEASNREGPSPEDVSTLGISDLEDSSDGEELEYHLRQSPNWDMDIYDYRGEDTVTILVGTNEDGEHIFSPAGIAIESGTTVRWKWTGENESSIYTSGPEDFSTNSTDEPGVHAEATFPANYATTLQTYSCTEHDDMNGAIVIDGVEDGA